MILYILFQAIIHDYNKHVTTKREDLCDLKRNDVALPEVDLQPVHHVMKFRTSLYFLCFLCLSEQSTRGEPSDEELEPDPELDGGN